MYRMHAGKDHLYRTILLASKSATELTIFVHVSVVLKLVTQCASAAPGSFQMLEQGRARTFRQRNSPDVVSAVASCPVDCMHYVSFDELRELEVARDVGVADDHRHFGHSSARGYIPPTPLHISRIDSDANHKSSFYQYVKR
jgi:hypothetical protein